MLAPAPNHPDLDKATVLLIRAPASPPDRICYFAAFFGGTLKAPAVLSVATFESS